MSIQSFIERVCVQTCIYWGNPQNNGTGGMTFDEPIDIKCRWEDKERLVKDHWGNEQRTRADVLLTRPVDSQGWLCLGSITDYDTLEELLVPAEVDGASEIIAFDKIPLFASTDKFVNTAFLGFSNIQK